MTTVDHPIHQAADRIADLFRAAGIAVRSVSHSINRLGGASSYIEVPAHGCRYRISDHEANTDFRIAETELSPSFSADDLPDLLARIFAAREQAATRRAAETAARDAYEAEAKAAWLASDKQHVRGDIIAKLYPTMGRMGRQEVARRWSAK